MTRDDDPGRVLADDIETLHRLGYAQELARRMGGFSNFAISLSIICVLSGGVTSFAQGFCSVGGASIGLGWPLACLFSLAVAAAMAQLASAFPTAGGLYHWAAILGGRGWGWATAWFNLLGLVTILAAVNVGACEFLLDSLAPLLGSHPPPGEHAWGPAARLLAVVLLTSAQAALNHVGIRATTRLTDFSGYWILLVATALTVGLVVFAPSFRPSRLVTFTNYGGTRGGDIWPASDSLALLFALGLLLPAYTITGFDASAHTSEETIGASANVPRGIVRSVLVSGLAGWLMLSAVVLAAPDMDAAAARGQGAFPWILGRVLPGPLALTLTLGIAVAQCLCGLATLTSASRMTFAFARDGGLPASSSLRRVAPGSRTPAVAIWTVAVAAVLFTVSTPLYSTIAAVCTVFLYVSYVLPVFLGVFAYGRTWTTMGPWDLGRWYRPVAGICVLGCLALIAIGVQPPNQRAAWVLAGTVAAMTAIWLGHGRRHFPGPPPALAFVTAKEPEAEQPASPR
jgi:amino acid transporter